MQAPVPGPRDFQLVPYGKEHDAQTVQWLNNAELRRDFGLSRPVTQESHRAWVERNPETIIWAITESDVHLGNVLLKVKVGRRAAYLQIYLGEPSTSSTSTGCGCIPSLTIRQQKRSISRRASSGRELSVKRFFAKELF